MSYFLPIFSTGLSSSTKVVLKTPGTVEEVTEGSRVSFQCKGDGNPTPEYSWYRDGTMLESSNTKYVMESNRLRIKAFELSDSGTYSCRAENSEGIVWSTGGNVTIDLNGRYCF